MKYMVMECHFSYAVVLDEDGRFLNVANRHYEVGQMVTDVIEMQTSQAEIQAKPKTHYKWIRSIAAMAACFMLIITSVYQFSNLPYGSVYLTINPEVRIDVNKNDIVVDVEGINEDGKTLVEDYNYKKKELNLVMEELIDRAIEMGFLQEGGHITLTLDADDVEWIAAKGASLETHLNEYLADKLSVSINIVNENSKNQENTAPIDTEVDASQNNYSESDYGEDTSTSSTDMTVPSEEEQNNYEDTDYGSNNDGATDYNDTDYGPNNDGVTNYEDTDYGPNNDGVTDYDSSHDDSQSNSEEDNDDSTPDDDDAEDSDSADDAAPDDDDAEDSDSDDDAAPDDDDAEDSDSADDAAPDDDDAEDSDSDDDSTSDDDGDSSDVDDDDNDED